MFVWSSLFCWSDWKTKAPTAAARVSFNATVRGVRGESGARRRVRSNSLGPLHQSQVGQEGVFVGGGRGWRAGGGRRAGGEEERRSGGPPSGVGVRVECEAAVVGEQGGEGDQVRLVAVPVLLQHVAGGGREEGGAAAEVPGAVGSVGAGEAAQGAGGVQLVGLAQRE